MKSLIRNRGPCRKASHYLVTLSVIGYITQFHDKCHYRVSLSVIRYITQFHDKCHYRVSLSVIGVLQSFMTSVTIV